MNKNTCQMFKHSNWHFSACFVFISNIDNITQNLLITLSIDYLSISLSSIFLYSSIIFLFIIYPFIIYTVCMCIYIHIRICHGAYHLMLWNFHTVCQKVTDRQAHMRAHIGCIQVEAAVQIKGHLHIHWYFSFCSSNSKSVSQLHQYF